MAWVFGTDQLHYSHNLPVRLPDLYSMKTRHPDVYQQFMKGNFVGHKSHRAFSGLPTDQLHEQLIRVLKGDGGIIGLTDYMDNFREFMVLAPELSRLIKEFEEEDYNKEYRHHEQYHSFQTTFAADIKALVSSFKDFGNPFMEDSGQLLALDSGKLMSTDIVNSVKNIQQLGTEQYSTFWRERITSNKVS